MRRRPWVLLTLLLVLLAGYSAASGGFSHRESVHETTEYVDFEEEERDEEDLELLGEAPEQWGALDLPPYFHYLLVGTTVFLSVLTILLILVAVLRAASDLARIFNARRNRQKVVATSDEHADIGTIRQAVAESLRRIDLGDSPREAIFACWLSLEEAADRIRVERKPSDTPGAFVTRLLDRADVDARSIRELYEVYLTARYSPHDITDSDVARARRTLRAISEQLGRTVNR
ncbi:DUF4129 domain-containing protein [Natronoglycomyces albus]|uniref:DUF4129 domain-containing protein n=1 Tax=Natronoglycomyces albus TaxID=2811108 RepID=A0A895XUN6_9ACTN|nr:DUF4129 domain-containing protein [Natronoglycomyces albus]QSB05940.1 DUF4129 domain-containing protein [Natronoglycomyces albus]